MKPFLLFMLLFLSAKLKVLRLLWLNVNQEFLSSFDYLRKFKVKLSDYLKKFNVKLSLHTS